MISLSPTLPPIEHDNALRLAMIYLSAAADPAGTKARLDELATQTQALRDAIAANEAAAAKASEVEAAQEAVDRTRSRRAKPRGKPAPGQYPTQCRQPRQRFHARTA